MNDDFTPPTFEEWNITCPQWAKDLMNQSVPLVVGLPVFDVYSAGKDGRAFAIVRAIIDDRVVVEYLMGEIRGAPATYYVPDLTDEVGQAYYQKWKRARV